MTKKGFALLKGLISKMGKMSCANASSLNWKRGPIEYEAKKREVVVFMSANIQNLWEVSRCDYVLEFNSVGDDSESDHLEDSDSDEIMIA